MWNQYIWCTDQRKHNYIFFVSMERKGDGAYSWLKSICNRAVLIRDMQLNGKHWTLIEQQESQNENLCVNGTGRENLFKTKFKRMEWGWPRGQCQTRRGTELL